jgi:F-type H+-transporting ATPase subunit a
MFLFPIAATIFLFILINAWIVLLPLYGPLVAVLQNGQEVPLLRGAGTDINMPLALSIFASLVIEGAGIFVLRGAYLQRFVRLHHLLRARFLMGTIDLFTGFLETTSEILRILSLTFRLFGTLTAAEVLLSVVSFLSPLIITIPFYGLELMVGAMQAAVFAGLTVAFAGVAMRPEKPPPAEEEDAGQP